MFNYLINYEVIRVDYQFLSNNNSSGSGFDVIKIFLCRPEIKVNVFNTMYFRVPELVKWVKGLQERSHSPPSPIVGEPWDLLITNGSQDGICKVI